MSRTVRIRTSVLMPLFLVLTLLVTVQTTSQAAETGTALEELPRTRPLRVTLLLEHRTASPWNTLLQNGLRRAEKEFSLETRVVVESDEDAQETCFRKAAADSDLTLIATDRFHEILRDNAADFRSRRFGVIDAGIRGSNITCISFADEPAAFLAGAAAAIFSRKQPGTQEPAIGWLSGEDVAAMRSMFHSFGEGARLIQPDLRVIHGTVGSFADPVKAREETRRMLREGVRVLVLAAGSGNSTALEEARKQGIHVIGLDTDQKDLYPQHVLCSIVKKADDAVYEIIRDTVRNEFRAREIRFYSLGHGVQLTAPHTSLGKTDTTISRIERRIQELTHEIENKGIQIRSLRARTLCNCL